MLHLLAWDGEEDSQLSCAQQEVCHAGDLSIPFLQEWSRHRAVVITTSPLNESGHGKSEDCQKEWNGDVS